MASFGGGTGLNILNLMFGPQIGQVRTQINAGTAAQTTINTGSVANGGASGNMDTTPANNSMIIIAHPGSGATQNQYSTWQAFIVTSSTATAMTVGSQTVNFQLSVGDPIFYVGLTTAPVWPFCNTLYFGLSTQAWSTSVTDANLLSGEPTSTGSYARVVCPTSTTQWPNASGPVSGVDTIQNAIAQTFVTSTAAWSTGATALASWFAGDASTLAGGHVLWSGALTPATDIVNGIGVTMSFAINALKATVT